MYTGLLHLHSLLRWIIVILLLISLFQSFQLRGQKSGQTGLQKTSLFLMIAAHITLVLGLFQWFTGDLGLNNISAMGMGEVMKNSATRFWAVEHLVGMLLAIVLITLARRKVKSVQYNAAFWMYIVALLLIIALVPWPFRAEIGRSWFPGM
jgi:hypothetical protein